MSKTVINIFIVIFNISYAFSQDIIVKQNGEEIETVIIEISSNNIKYKDFNYQDGPVRNMSVSDVFMIKYKNGTKELLNKIETSKTQTESDSSMINQYKKNDESKTFKVGVKAGVNFSTLNGDYYNYEIKGRTSFHFGVIMNFGLSKIFSLQPELLYSEQGFTVEYFNGNFYEIEKVKLNYLNIPVMASFEVTNGLNLQVGPQFGIETDNFPGDFDIGIGLGAQYTLPINLFFQARYIFGISDVNYNGKNRVASISLGYIFN